MHSTDMALLQPGIAYQNLVVGDKIRDLTCDENWKITTRVSWSAGYSYIRLVYNLYSSADWSSRAATSSCTPVTTGSLLRQSHFRARDSSPILPRSFNYELDLLLSLESVVTAVFARCADRICTSHGCFVCLSTSRFLFPFSFRDVGIAPHVVEVYAFLSLVLSTFLKSHGPHGGYSSGYLRISEPM